MWLKQILSKDLEKDSESVKAIGNGHAECML